jgi:hypothetical protein
MSDRTRIAQPLKGSTASTLNYVCTAAVRSQPAEWRLATHPLS